MLRYPSPHRSPAWRLALAEVGAGFSAAYATSERPPDKAVLNSAMSFYIFTRAMRLAPSWKLLEALNNPATAKEVFAGYRRAAEGSDAEVVMVEATSFRAAKEKLERFEERERRTLN